MRQPFPGTPAQMTELLEADAGLELVGVRGLDGGWSAPLAVWRARDGFDHTYGPNGHATLSVLLSGSARRMDGRFAGCGGRADGESFVLYGGGHARRYASPVDMSVCQMYFDDAFLAALAEAEREGSGAGLELRDDRIFSSDRALRQLCDAYVKRAFDHQRDPTVLETDAFAVLIALRLLQRHSNRALAPARQRGLTSAELRRLDGFIDSRLDQPLQLRDLANAIGLPPRRFLVGLNAAVGTTPHRYVMTRRLERARALLRGSAPISVVALACGFSSQQHLTTAFRRAWDVTPAAWRRQWRNPVK